MGRGGFFILDAFVAGSHLRQELFLSQKSAVNTNTTACKIGWCWIVEVFISNATGLFMTENNLEAPEIYLIQGCSNTKKIRQHHSQ